MANKTIDRKKAIAARSQSARVGAKSVSSRASSPTIDEEEQSNLKADSAALLDEEEDEMAESEEFEEEEDEEAEESDSADDEAEAEEEGEEEEEDEESRALEKAEERRVARRERREQGVLAVNPQDYAISKPSGGARLPDNTLVRFVRSSYRELRMVTWPTRQETWSWSLVVVAVSAFVAIILGAADLGLSKFVEWWISLAH